MLLRDLVLSRGRCWPSLLLHCALHPLWGLVQVRGGTGSAQRVGGWVEGGEIVLGSTQRVGKVSSRSDPFTP